MAATGAAVNFIPTIWEEKILQEKDKVQVLVKNCTRKWSGTIEKMGDEVVINSLDSPTVRTYVPGTDITVESPKDESRRLRITEANYFAVTIDDTTKAQATGGIEEELARKGAQALADTQEAFVAGLFTDAGKTITKTGLTSATMISQLTKARRFLHANNVNNSTEVCLEVGPAVFEKIVLAGIVNTDSVDPMKGAYEGYWSKILGMKVYVSNNITSVVTDDDVVKETCAMRTMEAIGFAEQLAEVEKYRPEGGFKDALKALDLSGAKVIKPKEIVCLQLTTAAETTI